MARFAPVRRSQALPGKAASAHGGEPRASRQAAAAASSLAEREARAARLGFRAAAQPGVFDRAAAAPEGAVQRVLVEKEREEQPSPVYYLDSAPETLYVPAGYGYRTGPRSYGVYQRLGKGGGYFYYNSVADLFKPSPPPPPKRQEPSLDLPPVITSSPPPLELPSSLWKQLDRLLAEGSNVGGKVPKDLKSRYGRGTLSSVTKYIQAQVGVYVISNANGDLLVVKGLSEPTREYFGSKIAEAIGLPHPDTQLFPVDSDEGATLLGLLQRNEAYKSNAKIHGVPKYLMVMTFVKGIDLIQGSSEEHGGEEEGAQKAREQLRSLVGEPQHVARILKEIAHIAALDVLLWYRDRTPVLGGGNLANVMLLVENAQITSAVAIDQAVRVSTEKRITDGLIPLEETLKAMTSIAEGEDKHVLMLWDGLPDQLRKIAAEELGLEEAVATVRQGLIEGFRNIVGRLDLEKVGEILNDTERLGLNLKGKRDGVDVPALLQALEALVKLFGD